MTSDLSSLIFPFGAGMASAEPDPARMGVKGANLLAMAALGIEVPPGFVVGTEIGEAYSDADSELSGEFQQVIRKAVHDLGASMGRKFGDPENPLLISVRSGAAVSMPGMMDTVLNLGLNEEIVSAFVRQSNEERFAWDTYRRFIQSYAHVVLGLDLDDFELVLEELRARENCSSDSQLSGPAMKEAGGIFGEIVSELSGNPFPQQPEDQLDGAILAVFRSWNTARARRYRDMQSISHEGGTAAVVQAMVFGNRDERSCTGVYFTRNPSTGEKKPYGEYMLNAQGEEVVSGIRTPHELTEEARIRALSTTPSMEKLLPDIYAQLLQTGDVLERHFGDLQEIEFTVDADKLWLLQTRNAKRTPKAAIKVAVDLAQEGLLSRENAVARFDTAMLAPMMVSKVTPGPDSVQFAKGLAASPGAVTGQVMFSSDEAVDAQSQGIDVILVRPETDPKDVHGMNASVGILTSRGGMTSHAAVVARGMNKPCITAAMTLKIDPVAGSCTSLGHTVNRGDIITIDGGSGAAYLAEQSTETPAPDGDLALLLSWKQGN